MDSAARDRFLRMILPAAGIVAIYCLWFSRQSEFDAAQGALVTARDSAVFPSDLLPMRLELAKIAEKQADLKKQKDNLDERWSRMAALPQVSAVKRAAAMRQLTGMLWDRGLVTFNETSDAASGQLPASFEDVVRRLGKENGATQPRLWKVSFYGRYADVAETLASLGDLDVAVVPVGLTMSEARPETDWRVWTLVLWI